MLSYGIFNMQSSAYHGHVVLYTERERQQAWAVLSHLTWFSSTLTRERNMSFYLSTNSCILTSYLRTCSVHLNRGAWMIIGEDLFILKPQALLPLESAFATTGP